MSYVLQVEAVEDNRREISGPPGVLQWWHRCASQSPPCPLTRRIEITACEAVLVLPDLNSQDPEGRHRRGCQRHWRVLGGLTGFCGSCSPKHIYFSYYHVLFAGGGEHRRWGEAYPAGRCCPLLPPSMLHSGTPHPLLSTNRCSNVWLPVKVRLLLSHQYQPCSIMYKYFIKIRFLSVKRMYNFRCEPATWDWSKQRRERKNNNRREQCYWSIWYIISLGPPLDSV